MKVISSLKWLPHLFVYLEYWMKKTKGIEIKWIVSIFQIYSFSNIQRSDTLERQSASTWGRTNRSIFQLRQKALQSSCVCEEMWKEQLKLSIRYFYTVLEERECFKWICEYHACETETQAELAIDGVLFFAQPY